MNFLPSLPFLFLCFACFSICKKSSICGITCAVYCSAAGEKLDAPASVLGSTIFLCGFLILILIFHFFVFVFFGSDDQTWAFCSCLCFLLLLFFLKKRIWALNKKQRPFVFWSSKLEPSFLFQQNLGLVPSSFFFPKKKIQKTDLAK